MKTALFNELVDRAKTKNNGVYSYEHTKYAVKDNNLVFISDRGRISQVCYGMLIELGTIESWNEVGELKRLLKKEEG